MSFIQTIKLAWRNIIGNKMRSFLTMLGMIIGVASVIILVSLMNGVVNQALKSYESFGINEVRVNLTGKNASQKVTLDDFYEYADQHKSDLNGVAPIVDFYMPLQKGSIKMDYTHVLGVDENYMNIKKRKLATGCGITYSDISIRRKDAVIGSYVNQTLFGGNAQIGDTFQMEGDRFVVAGIMEQKSDNAEWSEDNMILIPYATAERVGGVGGLGYVFYAKSTVRIPQITKEIESYLYSKLYDKQAYQVSNMADALKNIKQQQIMFTSAIGGIAGISLLVAGIGIMNIMLVSVSERTREIGIRKSMGAKRRDIMRQFVMEAATTSSLGGIIGIILGSLGTVKIGQLVKVEASAGRQIIIIAFCISAGVGILFGYMPARKAAKMNPIDALRSE